MLVCDWNNTEITCQNDIPNQSWINVILMWSIDDVEPVFVKCLHKSPDAITLSIYHPSDYIETTLRVHLMLNWHHTIKHEWTLYQYLLADVGLTFVNWRQSNNSIRLWCCNISSSKFQQNDWTLLLFLSTSLQQACCKHTLLQCSEIFICVCSLQFLTETLQWHDSSCNYCCECC